MLTRRSFILAAGTVLMIGAFAGPAAFASDSAAASFIKQVGEKLVATINAAHSQADKQAAFRQIVDSDVDVNGVARFCLGRYWNKATDQQKQEYLHLFHDVLVRNVTGKIGEYQGVTFSVGRTVPQGADSVVQTTIVRPGNAPNMVGWVVADENGSPKIVDVIAEGTSLRLTQRSDYASYLDHNGQSVQALIDALKRQAHQG